MDVAARHHLAVVYGPGVGWVLPLVSGAAVVGRGTAADLVLADPQLSRAHLQVRDRGGLVRIRDLGSVNGTRVIPARGAPVTGSSARLARRPRRVGRRWQPLPVGSRVLAGSVVLELRVHPGMVLPVELQEHSDLSGGLLGRLLFPLLMSVSALPLLLGGGGGAWRLVLLVALPVVLLAAILWPALRDRARRLRRTGQHDEQKPPVPQPVADPAALLAAAGAPVPLPEEGPRWEIGNANTRAPVPHRPGRGLRGRAGRRAEQMRFVPVPEPGSGLALVGDAGAVAGLGRWLALRHHAVTGERVDAPWSELTGLAGQDAECANPGLRVHTGTADLLTRPDRTARHLVLAPTMAAVPRWCAAVLEVRAAHNRQVSPEWAAAVLAELDSADDGGASVPTSVHLAELLEQAEPGEPATPPRAWSDPVVHAPLGMGSHGPVWLDLAEHGPHALVAGTTGSGKSELLLAWILGLAHQASPADTQFVLFDYKGGATFAPLRTLAHVVGVLTDLDEAATARALASLQAELRARERALAAVGAHDLVEQRRRTSGADRLGRLLVVVDEFRVMADAHPEQLDALVRLAAQGRSLGIHLVLATQRPGGAITPDMRANLTVRVCLRVLEETDSLDMLGDTRAAKLPRVPGRAVLRTEESDELQTAWCGAAADGWVTDRVATLNAAAEQLAEVEPWRRSLRRPWAPPLPDACEVADLDTYGLPVRAVSAVEHVPRGGTTAPHPGAGVAAQQVSIAEPAGYRLPWALLDLPEEQRLGPRSFAGGTLLVSGGPGSGRSTALHMLTEAALRAGTAVQVIAEEAQDWPGGEAPGAGTWCPLSDPRRLRRLLERLLAGDSPGLLVLDDVDAVAESLDETGNLGEGVDLVLTVLRRARRLGLDVVLSATESSRRWAMATDQQLVLCPRDPADAVLAGAPRKLVAAGWPPGRGVLLERGDAWVAQVLLPQPEPEEWQDPEDTPLRLAALPAIVHLEDAPVSVPGTADHTQQLLLGRGGDDARWLRRSLAPGGTWLVCGPPRSGRSTAVETISAQLRRSGWRVLDARAPVPEPVPAAAGTALVVDDVDRLPGTTAEEWTTYLDAHPEVAVLGTGRAESVATTFHPLAVRLREPDLSLVLADPRPAHLPNVDLRPVQDPVTRPGRGVLVDPGGSTPLQVATAARREPTS